MNKNTAKSKKSLNRHTIKCDVFTVHIDNDNLSASITFNRLTHSSDEQLQYDNIAELLKENSIVFGIDKDAIQKIIYLVNQGQTPIYDTSGNITPKHENAQNDTDTPLCIARGIPAEIISVPKINWAAEFPDGKNGSYYVRPGYIIAQTPELEVCTQGKDIFGNAISCPINQAKDIIPDQYISHNESTNTYTATIAGLLKITTTGNNYHCSIDPLLTVSADVMSAYIDIHPRSVDNKRLTSDELVTSLKILGITTGINHNAINTALQSDEIQIKILVASGTKPVNGVSAHIHYHRQEQTTGLKLHNGRIDFHEHNYPWNLKTGETIGYMFEAKPKIDGCNVRGETIKAREAKKVVIQLDGAHTDDKKRVIADIDGALIVNANKVSVADLLVIHDDINHKTGNIRTESNVHVKGHIEAGYKIETTKSAIIEKNVEDAHISCGGNIVIKGGIRGHKSEIYTPSDINVGFIENAEVFVNGDIHVAESIINSKVSSNSDLTVGSNKSKHSAIIGGRTTARRKIEAQTVGTDSYHHTLLCVGFTQENKQRQRDLRNQIATMEHELSQLDQLDAYYRHHTEHNAHLILAKSQATRIVLSNELKPLKKKLQQLLDDIHAAGDASICINKKVYPGVKMMIDECTYHVEKEMTQGIFTLKGDKIIFTPQ